MEEVGLRLPPGDETGVAKGVEEVNNRSSDEQVSQTHASHRGQLDLELGFTGQR